MTIAPGAAPEERRAARLTGLLYLVLMATEVVLGFALVWKGLPAR